MLEKQILALGYAGVFALFVTSAACVPWITTIQPVDNTHIDIGIWQVCYTNYTKDEIKTGERCINMTLDTTYNYLGHKHWFKFVRAFTILSCILAGICGCYAIVNMCDKDFSPILKTCETIMGASPSFLMLIAMLLFTHEIKEEPFWVNFKFSWVYYFGWFSTAFPIFHGLIIILCKRLGIIHGGSRYF